MITTSISSVASSGLSTDSIVAFDLVRHSGCEVGGGVDVRAPDSHVGDRANPADGQELGLSIEPPRLDATERVMIEPPQEPVVFLPGMTLVVQPHVVSADRTRRLQVGSLVAVTEDGAEVMQRHPMELSVLNGDTGIVTVGEAKVETDSLAEAEFP